MLFSTEIPHLKIIKQRSYLPRDVKNPTKGSIALLCNIEDKYLNNYIDYKLAYHDAKYNQYYKENHYKGKIGARAYNIIDRENRINHYKDVEKKYKRLTAVKTFESAREKNMYFSLQRFNEIFFDKSKDIIYNKKVPIYINYLVGILSDERFKTYNTKFIMINIEEWVNHNSGSTTKKNKFNDPIFILYFAMLKYNEKFKELGDINFIFFTNTTYLRMNPSKCTKKEAIIFKRELSKLNKTFELLDNEDVVEDIIQKEEMRQNITSLFLKTNNFTGDTSEKVNEVVKDRIEEISDEVIEKNVTMSPKEIEKEITEKVNEDEIIVKKLHSVIMEEKTGKSTASLKRDEELRSKQGDIKLKGVTIKDLSKIQASAIKLKEVDVSDKIVSTNKNTHIVRFPDFEESYNKNLMKKDTMDIFTGLNDKSIPVFIKNVEVEDTSNEMNLKETYTVELEDSNRVRHTIKVDMPLFIDEKFMYLGGNRKLINKQLIMKPIAKIGPQTIQIVTNYKKVTLTRHGVKLSPKAEKLKKILSTNVYPGVVVKKGNHTAENLKFKSIIEYDELSADYDEIVINGTRFMFSQKHIESELTKYKYLLKPNTMCVGFDKNGPLICNTETQLLENGKDIIDHMISLSSSKMQEDFGEAKSGKKFMYTRASIMSKNISLAMLICYYEGITTVLRKAKIKHHFTDTRPKVDTNVEGVIQFNNGYLVYDKYPFENSLLMNAFADMPTKAFDYEDMDTQEPYLVMFESMFKSRSIGNALLTFYEWMIDPISKEVLEDFNYPTDFVDLLIYANRLLVDNSCIKEYDMNLYRVRSNEIINTYLYRAISHAYATYKQTSNNKNPVKMSIPRDVVIKEILTAQTVEDYSVLNPIVELEKSRAITPKGPSGLNVDRAYTQEKRSYDKTMMGLIAVSTTPDAGCGIMRTLSLEPNIKGPRGYIDINDNDLDSLKDVNLFSPAELLSPMGVTRDDTIRTAIDFLSH